MEHSSNPQIVIFQNLWSLHPREGKHTNINKIGKPDRLINMKEKKYSRRDRNASVAAILDKPH